jgi:hypothetical protein
MRGPFVAQWPPSGSGVGGGGGGGAGAAGGASAGDSVRISGSMSTIGSRGPRFNSAQRDGCAEGRRMPTGPGDRAWHPFQVASRSLEPIAVGVRADRQRCRGQGHRHRDRGEGLRHVDQGAAPKSGRTPSQRRRSGRQVRCLCRVRRAPRPTNTEALHLTPMRCSFRVSKLGRELVDRRRLHVEVYSSKSLPEGAQRRGVALGSAPAIQPGGPRRNKARAQLFRAPCRPEGSLVDAQELVAHRVDPFLGVRVRPCA